MVGRRTHRRGWLSSPEVRATAVSDAGVSCCQRRCPAIELLPASPSNEASYHDAQRATGALSMGAALSYIADMDWTPLLATLFGAAIATGSALLVDVRRDRRESLAEWRRGKRDLYGAYLGMLSQVRSELQLIILDHVMSETERKVAARQSFARCYEIRYQLEVFAPRAVVEPALDYFRSVRRAREATIRGVSNGDEGYEAAFQDVMQALTAVRAAMRRDMGTDKLPAD